MKIVNHVGGFCIGAAASTTFVMYMNDIIYS